MLVQMLMHKIGQVINLADQHYRKNDHPQLKCKRKKRLKRRDGKIDGIFHKALNLGRLSFFQHLLDKISQSPNILRLDIIKKDRSIEMLRVRHGFRSDNNTLAGNSLG